ncbi:hypothetical protein J4464_07210 [Candidatus Woesearchaeota archaeon]|nr:hypothetical protein [Candidatus Woesearchaeota archaeon]
MKRKPFTILALSIFLIALLYAVFVLAGDATPPAITAVSPANNTVVSNTIWINFSLNIQGSIIVNVSNASSGANVAVFSETNKSSINISFNTRNGTFKDGNYTIRAVAFNATFPTYANQTSNTTIIQGMNISNAPLISSVLNSSITASSVVITWTTSEEANSTVYFGLTKSLEMARTSTAFTTSNSVTITSLNTTTQYFFNVTSCDPSGNCTSAQDATGPFNFTTAAAAAAAAAATATSSNLPTGSSFVTGSGVYQAFKVGGQKTVFFPVSKGGSEKHTVKITSIDGTTVTIELASTPQTIVVKPGQPAQADLDGDGVDDVEISLNGDPSKGVASLFLRSLVAGTTKTIKPSHAESPPTVEAEQPPAPAVTEPEAPAPEAPEQQPLEPAPAAPPAEEKGSNTTAIIVAVVVIIAALVGIVYYFRAGKKRR